MKAIKWHNRTRKQLRKIPQNFRTLIIETVGQLATFPDCEGLDIKPLKSHRYEYRLRVNRYRVLFDNQDEMRIIAIQEVKKRDERTY